MSARSGTETRQRVVPVLVRLTPAESDELDKAVSRGRFSSRPEALRGGALAEQVSPDQLVMPVELMGGKELAALFARGGVPLTKQQVYTLGHSEGFPEPLQRLANGPVWDGAAIRAYKAKLDAR